MLEEQQQLDNNNTTTTTTTNNISTTTSRRSIISSSDSGSGSGSGGSDEIMMIHDDSTNLPTSLDGMLIRMYIEQQYMPSPPPDLRRGDPGVNKVRVIIKAKDEYKELCNHISKKLMKSMCISDCAFFDPHWICAMGVFERKSRQSGEIHRDTYETTGGHLAVLIFLDDCDSGGVKFWRNSHDFMSGEQFDRNKKPKNYLRKLRNQHGGDTVIIQPQKNMAVIFDVRVIHQSLAHWGEKQRNVLKYSIACNGCEKVYNY